MSRLLLALLLAVTLCAPALAASVQGDCTIEFTGASFLHSFSGTGACRPFSVEIDADGVVAPLDLHVPVAGLETGNSRRDKNMREMFEMETFPDVVGHFQGGQLAELRASLAAAAAGQGTVPLTLTIRSVEVPVAATITQLIDNDQAFSFDLAYTLSLAACQLEPPSVLGLIRVADELQVRNRLHLRPLPAK